MAKKIKVEVDLEDKQAKKKLEDLTNKKYKVDLDVDSNGVKNVNEQVQKLGNTASSTTTVFGKLKNAISNTFSFNKITTTGYLAVLNEINQAGKNAKETIQELDSAITDLSVAMNGTRAEASEYIKTLNKQAIELKTTTKSVTDASDAWLRQGKTVDETETLIKDSLVLSKVGKIDSADATDYLTSALNGYKLEAKDAISVIDKLISVDAASASEAGGLALSMSRTASAADMAGVSMDKLISWLAVVKETSRDADQSVGNMMKTMLSRMNQVKAGKFIDEETGEPLNDMEKVLNKVGIAMRDANGQFISSEKIIDELGQKWSTFDSVTQRAIATQLGGAYQYEKVIALLSNYGDALKYAEIAAESSGSAMQKFNESYLGSLEAKQNTLQASFESMIMNSDFDEVYGGILEATTALVNFINETNALKDAMSGLTIGAGIKAFIAIKGGINEAYIELNKFQNALKIVKKTEISTESFERLKLLCDGLSKSQMKLVLSTNQLSVEQKKELLMASSLSEEEATLQLQTWNMAKANNGLTTSTTSVSNAFKGLWSTIKANKFMLITSAIMIGVSAINKYKETLENARSAAEDAKSTLSDMNKSVTDNGSWLAENTDRYKELSEGVNSLGQNVSLTDEEFKEYNTLTNEIAEMFPTLVTGYTDTGDAILSCKNNVDLLTKAYEEQKQAAQDSVLQKSNDLWAGFKADTTKSNIFSNGGLSKVSELQSLQKMINGQVKDISNGALAQILNNAGVDKVNGNNRAKLVKQIEENKQLLLSYVRTLQSTLDASTSQITPIIDAFLGDNKDFQKFDSQTQNSIKQIADNMGYEFYSQFENTNELVNWIDNTLVPAFQNADTKNLLTKLFSLNKEDMPVSEYVQEINSLIEQIANAIGGEPDKIKVKLGFDFVDTDEELLNKAKKKVDEAFSNNSLNVGSVSLDPSKLVNKDELKKWIDTLSSEDLKLIAKGEIKFDENTTVESAKQALDAAKKAVDESSNSLFSDFDGTDIGERLQYISSQFEEGKISYKDYFDSLQNEIENVDFSNYTDSIEEANAASQIFFTDSMQQVSSGLSDLVESFDNGQISASEYIDGYESIAETLSSLTDSLQENSEAWNENGQAIDSGLSSELDSTQEALDNSIARIDELKDSIYSMSEIMSGSLDIDSDEYSAHIQVVAEDLANIVAQSGEMAEQIKSTLGTTTEEIADNMSENVDNQSLAAQAIVANTNTAISDMASSVGKLFDTLGKEISNFNVNVSFAPKKISSTEVDMGILGKHKLPKVEFELKASGKSLSSVGAAISGFGKDLKNNLESQKISLNDLMNPSSNVSA